MGKISDWLAPRWYLLGFGSEGEEENVRNSSLQFLRSIFNSDSQYFYFRFQFADSGCSKSNNFFSNFILENIKKGPSCPIKELRHMKLMNNIL